MHARTRDMFKCSGLSEKVSPLLSCGHIYFLLSLSYSALVSHRWLMWPYRSCLSMRWTNSTRCRDTCWTWVTRQALWLPWQRRCWLAVSPRLVFMFFFSSAAARCKAHQRGLWDCLLSPGWPFPTHSYRWSCATCTFPSYYLLYGPPRLVEFSSS